MDHEDQDWIAFQSVWSAWNLKLKQRKLEDMDMALKLKGVQRDRVGYFWGGRVRGERDE